MPAPEIILHGSTSRNQECVNWQEMCIGNLREKNLFFKTIHAGLECGLFYNRMNKPDIVSYGPDIYDIHTFEERMDIVSAKRVYELTVELLKNM